MYSEFNKGIWNGLWSRRKGNPATKNWDYYFCLSFILLWFKRNWGPSSVPPAFPHLWALAPKSTSDSIAFPSPEKIMVTRDHTTAEGGSDSIWAARWHRKKITKTNIFFLEDSAQFIRSFQRARDLQSPNDPHCQKQPATLFLHVGWSQ